MAANTIVLIDSQQKVLYEETLEEDEANETEMQLKDYGNVEVYILNIFKISTW